MILTETYDLHDGVSIPKLGLGTWRMGDDEAVHAVREAIALGYRHIDTAQAYGNERGVGEGVRTSGIPRDEIFVTTKVGADIKDYEGARSSIDASLAKLGLGHIDLMLIHSPQPWSSFRNGEHYFDGNLEVWRALEDAHEAGKIRAIGVSNFEAADLANILRRGSLKPTVNQVLAHVGNTPFDLIEYARSEDILVEAYSPVAHGNLLRNGDLLAMAERYGVTVPQLCIRYCLQLGLLPLPKTANPEHMRSNAAIDFEISAGDMENLKNAERIKDYGEASHFPVFGLRS